MSEERNTRIDPKSLTKIGVKAAKGESKRDAINLTEKHQQIVMPVIRELARNEVNFRAGLGAFNGVSDELMQIIGKSKKLSKIQKQNAEDIFRLAAEIHTANGALEAQYTLLQTALDAENYIEAKDYLQNIIRISKENEKLFIDYTILYDDCSDFMSKSAFEKNGDGKLFLQIEKLLGKLKRPEGSDIGTFLVLPVQRVTRYPMTMNEVQKQVDRYREKTGIDHPFAQYTPAAVVALKSFAKNVNQAKGIAESNKQYNALKLETPFKPRADLVIKVPGHGLIERDEIFSGICAIKDINGYKVTIDPNPKNKKELFVRNEEGLRIAHITYNDGVVACRVRKTHMDYDVLEAMTSLMTKSSPEKDPAISIKTKDKTLQKLFESIRIKVDSELSPNQKVLIKISGEMLTTEKSYLEKLAILTSQEKTIIGIIDKDTDSGATLEQKKALKDLLKLAKEIQKTNKEMGNAFKALNEGYKANDQAAISKVLGDISSIQEQSAKLHSKYNFIFEKELNIYDPKANKLIANLNRVFRKIPEAKNLDAGSLFIQPIQRFPRYGMFSKELVKHTDDSSPSSDFVKTLSNKFAKDLDSMNERLKSKPKPITPMRNVRKSVEQPVKASVPDVVPEKILSPEPNKLSVPEAVPEKTLSPEPKKPSEQSSIPQQIAKHLLDSETRYLDNLVKFTAKDKELLQVIDDDKTSGATQEQKRGLQELIAHAKAISKFNVELKDAFDDVQTAYADGEPEKIAAALNNVGELIETTKSMHNNYIDTLTKIDMFDPNVSKLVKKMDKVVEPDGLTASDFLIEPTQRIMKYETTLSDLLKNTDLSNLDGTKEKSKPKSKLK